MGHDDVARRLQERMEQDAVRTTIVGGRPPGSGQAVGAVPRGVELLLKKAAVDGGFRTELIENRAGAAERLGLSLTAGEKMMLRAVSAEQLGRMIAQTRVPESAVGALMGQAAAVMLAALGLVQFAGCDQGVYSAGVRPVDRGTPPNTQSQPASATSPDLTKTGSAGLTLDSAGFTVGVPSTTSTGPSTSTAPATEPAPPLTKGIRPDVPPMLTKGIRPDVPEEPRIDWISQGSTETMPMISPVSRGVRPDVPPTKPAPTQPATTQSATFELSGRNAYTAGVTVGGDTTTTSEGPTAQTQPARRPQDPRVMRGVMADIPKAPTTQTQPATTNESQPATQKATLNLTGHQTYTGRSVISAGVLVMSPERPATQTQPSTEPTAEPAKPGAVVPDPAPTVTIFGLMVNPPATQTQPASEPASQTKPATQPKGPELPPPEPRLMAGVRRD